jgi:hypothetical protein
MVMGSGVMSTVRYGCDLDGNVTSIGFPRALAQSPRATTRLIGSPVQKTAHPAANAAEKKSRK